MQENVICYQKPQKYFFLYQISQSVCNLRLLKGLFPNLISEISERNLQITFVHWRLMNKYLTKGIMVQARTFTVYQVRCSWFYCFLSVAKLKNFCVARCFLLRISLVPSRSLLFVISVRLSTNATSNYIIHIKITQR